MGKKGCSVSPRVGAAFLLPCLFILSLGLCSPPLCTFFITQVRVHFCFDKSGTFVEGFCLFGLLYIRESAFEVVKRGMNGRNNSIILQKSIRKFVRVR